MKCKKCKNPQYQNELCKSCFSRYVEHKIRKEIRTNKLIQKNDKLIITNPLCKFIIKRIIKDMPIKILKKGKGKKVLPWTIENETNNFLTLFLNNKKLRNLDHGKDIKLFLSLKEQEIKAYAKIKGFEFKSHKKDKIDKTIDEVEKKHPQTKYSLLKSIKEIKEAKKKVLLKLSG